MTGGPRASGPSLVEACHRNLIGRSEFLARVVPGGSVENIGGLTAVRAGTPGPRLNVVFGLNHPTSVREVREGIERLFLRKGTEFRIVTLPETLGELEPIIEEMCMTERDVLPGMVLDPIPGGRHTAPAGLEIRQVSDPQGVSDLIRTGAQGMGVPIERLEAWRPALLAGAAGHRPRSASYVGYVGGKPVATSTRITTGDVAGLYFVSTLPDFRRRGYGESMTWRAMEDGRSAGCALGFLQASEMGRAIYERMGFRFLEEYSDWQAKPPTQEGTPSTRG
jgi:ribosomal protein S18 acetylase RimI-like enzyme